MADEKLTPERAVRLLRAKAGELENIALAGHGYHADRPMRETDELRADIALVASLLADLIERTMRASRSDRPTDPHQ